MAEPTSARRLKIAVFNRTFSCKAGGAEHYSVMLVEHLAQRHEIHVYAQQIDHTWPEVVYHKIPLLLARPRWLNQLWFAAYTGWQTRAPQHDFDIIHSHENTWCGQVQTVHVQPIKHGLFSGRSGWRLIKRCLQVATSPRLWTYLLLENARFAPHPPRVVVAVSQTTLSTLLNAYPKLANRTAVLSPGVSLPCLPIDSEQQAQQRHTARELLELPPSAFLVAFIGNDANKKGLPTLLRALAKLPAHIHLAAVTHTDHILALQKQTLLLKIADRVHFVKQLADITPVYRAADMLAHPTSEDSFGMVVLEAMAHALPVVVSGARWCGIAAELETDKQALIIDDPFDAAALAELIGRLQNNPALAERIAHHARRFAEQHDWATKARQQEAIYYRIAEKQTKLQTAIQSLKK